MRTPTIAVGVLSALLALSPAFSAIASAGSGTPVAESASPAPSATPTPAVSPAPTTAPSTAPSPAPKHDNTTTYIIIGVVVVVAVILIVGAVSRSVPTLSCNGTPNCSNGIGAIHRAPELRLQLRFR